jgi:hypothetical protein
VKSTLLALLMVIAGTALRAAEPVTPDTDKHNVLSFAASNSSADIEYRYMFHDSHLAAIAFLGYSEISSKFNSGAVNGHQSSHTLDLGAGLRHYFMPGEQLRPFVQADVIRSSSGESCTGIFVSPTWNYSATGGAEYFLGKRFSVEGRAGVRYQHGSSNCSGVVGGSTTTSFHVVTTFRSALAINFYF